MARKNPTILERVQELRAQASQEVEHLKNKETQIDAELTMLHNRSVKIADKRDKTNNIIKGLDNILDGVV